MPRRHATRRLLTSLLIAATGVAVGALWAARRRQRASVRAVLPARAPALPRARVVPPGGDSFDGERQLTAVPHLPSPRSVGADDYETIGPDELSAAFLSRATESWGELEVSESGADGELDGFQIATIEDLVAPELADDPADFEVPRSGRGRVNQLV